jgi:putative ATP-binding cassette transporter
VDAEGVSLDRLTRARFLRAATAFARADVGRKGKLLFGLLIVLMLGINTMNVLNSYVGRDFMTAIEQRSQSAFASKALLYLAVFCVSTVLAVLYRFVEERLGLLWREWLTRLLVLGYVERGTPYRLREQERLDNPDQRIGDDVRAFTQGSLSFVLMLLNGTFTILAFASVMWSISPTLFGVAVAYAAAGSLLTVFFGRPLIWLSYRQSDREASFRADLVHVRENAESVALLRREGRLRVRLLRRVDELVANARRIVSVNRNLAFFTTGYNYLIQIIPALIVGPLFMRGRVEFGVITQSAMAFSHLIGAFSLIVTQFQQISSYAAVLARLARLSEGMDRVEAATSPIEMVEAEGSPLVYENLTLLSPHDGQLLVSRLNARIPHGRRVVVVGPNEPAKTALFRATASVWDTGEGRIQRPSPDEIMFVPERPYLPPGTLREALLRTGREYEMRDEQILAVLRKLSLEPVLVRVGGFDVERDWDDLLSLGEQQEIVVARMLLARPRFALLHRIDTVLGPDAVARVRARLAEAGITAIELDGAEVLQDGDASVLEIRADGSWSYAPLRPLRGGARSHG